MLNTLIVTFALLGSPAAQIEKRTCDHPAPPEGMHYVCYPKDSCDCRLEKDASDNGLAESGAATEADTPCSSATLKYFVAPAYPPAARTAKKQGTVNAHLTVDATGKPQVKIQSGDPQLAEAVVAALDKWRFTLRGQTQTITATFTFAIAGDASDAMRTTVAGSSPFNLVISASPPLH